MHLLLKDWFSESTLLFSLNIKIVISEAENGMRQEPLSKGLTDVLRMAQTQKLNCLPKQAPLTNGIVKLRLWKDSECGRTVSVVGQQVWQAALSPWASTMARKENYLFPCT